MLGILAACVLVVALPSAWWVKSNLYASPFNSTTLTATEQQALDAKLDRPQRNTPSRRMAPAAADAATKSEGCLAPQPYTEDAARRELRLTEKELNALIAKDEVAAQRVAIALSTAMVSVKLVVPVDEDFPILGGKTIRLNCGMTLRYEAGNPMVALRGVSIGGVPIQTPDWATSRTLISPASSVAKADSGISSPGAWKFSASWMAPFFSSSKSSRAVTCLGALCVRA